MTTFIWKFRSKLGSGVAALACAMLLSAAAYAGPRGGGGHGGGGGGFHGGGGWFHGRGGGLPRWWWRLPRWRRRLSWLRRSHWRLPWRWRAFRWRARIRRQTAFRPACSPFVCAAELPWQPIVRQSIIRHP